MLIILDRDGVINEESSHFIKSVREWIPIPGSLEAIAQLRKAGHQVVVATNQSGIARGLLTEKILSAIHQQLDVDGIYYCPHHPEDHCHCRKPNTGLLEKIAADFNADLHDAWMVGDSLRDLEAGRRMGCHLALVKTGNGLQTLSQSFDFSQVAIFDNLAGFARFFTGDLPHH